MLLHRFGYKALQTWKWTQVQQLTQREYKEEQRERDQVESWLLIDLSDGIDGHNDEQRDTGEHGTLQEGQQDRREQEIDSMHHAYPHGMQTRTWI